MKLVAAGAHLDVGAGFAAVLGGVVAALHFELLKRIHDWVECHIVAAVIHHGDAIDVDLHPGVARAVGDDAGAVGAGGELRRLGDAHAGSEHGKLHETAAVERQVDDAFRGDDFAEGGVFGLEERGSAGDLDSLLHFTDLHGEIDAGLVVKLDGDAVVAAGAEARGLRFHTVIAGDEIAHFILPILRGFERA